MPSPQIARALALLLALPAASAAPCAGNASTARVGFYAPTCDADGQLLPPAAFGSIMASVDAAVAYIAKSPLDLPLSHGFPPFVWATFTADFYLPTSLDIIAGMQDGMGLLGYLKLMRRIKAGRGGASNATAALEAAVFLGDYLTLWTNTPATGVWANVTRSTGLNIEWPLFTASQGDIDFGINCIETDRVGMAGFALLKLYEATGTQRYKDQALHNARVLAATQAAGNATHAPWPFRVDSVSGAFLNGNKNGESVFPLRLFRALAAAPYNMAEFTASAASLWAWILNYQLPTATPTITPAAALFVNFFEDRTTTLDNNRNSWTALELARYLIEQRDTGLDPSWRAHVDSIFIYALTLFGYASPVGNVTLMGEQDDDRKGWGGASSKLGGVATMYACAGGPAWLGAVGVRNANHMAYYTDVDGCRSAQAYEVGAVPERGGWTEDAWLDVMHNLVDAAEAADGFCGPW